MSKFAPFDSSFCTHIFICMPIWLADIVSTWKNVNKETSSELPLRPNFNILYHCLYLRGCPQIHILFYSGLHPPSFSPVPHSRLTKYVWATSMKICLYPPFFAQQQIWRFCFFFFSETSMPYFNKPFSGFNKSIWIGVQTCVHCLGFRRTQFRFLFPEVVIQNFLGKRFPEPKNGICNYVINLSSLKNNRKEIECW